MQAESGKEMPSPEGTWLVPFHGREYSGAFHDNFLWVQENVYVMDNHRLALWCWLRHLRVNERVDFIHIDEHYDCYGACHAEWVQALPQDIAALSLNDYRKFPWNGRFRSCPLFRFDNYLSLFLERYGELVEQRLFFTRRVGDRPAARVTEIDFVDLLSWLHLVCSEGCSRRVLINIDLDYFVESGFGPAFRIVTSEYLEALGRILRGGLKNNSIACLTVALSPEFCKSWKLSEELASLLLKPMGLGFALRD